MQYTQRKERAVGLPYLESCGKKFCKKPQQLLFIVLFSFSVSPSVSYHIIEFGMQHIGLGLQPEIFTY